MDPYELDDEYKDHCNRTDWLNPSAEDSAATIGTPGEPYEPPCYWCRQRITLGTRWVIYRSVIVHPACLKLLRDAYWAMSTPRPLSLQNADLVTGGAEASQPRRLVRRTK